MPFITRTLLAASAAIMLAATAPAQSPPPPETGAAARCSAMLSGKFGDDVEITSASWIPAAEARRFRDQNGWQVTAALPAHCRIEGIKDRRIGAGGREYGLRFALALPQNWQGRFLFQGGGGLNGMVREPLGPVAAGGDPALARGFAVISTDSGHTGAVFDPSFEADQRAMLDFAETSVLTVTELGKAITRSYYQRGIAHSYLTGCSTGGREGMLAIQRYPEQFDGVIIGAPAMRAGDSNLAIEYTTVLLNAIAPGAAEGKPDLKALLSPAVRKTLVDGMLAQCDKLDGLADGMIENIAACHFDPKQLVCKPGASAGCISGELAATLDKAFAGPFDKAGYPLYVPAAWDTGVVALPMGYLPSGGPTPFGPASTATSIDLDARINAIRWDAGNRLTDTPYWTNLNTFLGRGGKVMFFHGMSDFWFSPWATWDYYQRAAKANGPAFTDASRLYMVPGMLHCQGGNSYDQFDMLTALTKWVEQDTPPGTIVAQRSDGRAEARPLCPYPAHAQYVGGDPAKAASYRCEQPA